ncbi:MAG: DUF4159 domain-containing protein [Verrucomicrobia bacterium]|nr:DUF4159 domain-containing protein [Verrucomicrobiota bacterium]
MELRRNILLLGAWAALGASAGLAQFPRGSWRGGFDANEDDTGSLVRTEGSGIIDENLVRTARETMSHSTGTPNWSNPRGFEKDVFTFARAIFKVGPNLAPGYGRGRRLGWWVDYPDADLNFSYRLQQLTSAKVDPDGRVMKLTNPELFGYPFILMEHPGYMQLRDDEAGALRKYLLTGGTLVVIDFWNTREWDGFAAQMKRVMPERGWTDLTTDHPIFSCVFDLKRPMKRLQVPTMQFWYRHHNPDDPNSPLQIDRGEGSEEMHVRVMLDDKQRIMAIAVHNSDITDGWEREGEHDDYFRTFSEKVSYPFGINLFFYLMTH